MNLYLSSLSNFLITVLFFCLAGLSVAASAERSDKTNGKLRFALVSTEEPPFIYSDSEHELTGIVPSLAQALSRDLVLELEYVPISRKGLEQGIRSGKADVAWLSPDWVENKQQLIFSTPIFSHQEFLYSLSPFAESHLPLDWVKGKTICIRQDYQYPSLSRFFAKNLARSVEVSNQVPLLQLLLKGRCDLLYMNEHRTSWMISRLGIKHLVWRSAEPLKKTNLALMFNPEWQSQMSKINQALINIKHSGELDAIIQTHVHPAVLSKTTPD